MTLSGTMPKHRRRFGTCLPMLCLVQLCLTLLGFSPLTSFSFVHSASSDHQRKRFIQLRRAKSGQPEMPDSDNKADARKLTVAIKKASSAKKLIDILDETVDRPIFNFFHVSVVYSRLSDFKSKLQESDWDGPVLLRLHDRVQKMVLQDQINDWASVRVLYTISEFSDFSIPTQLLTALVKSLPSKAKDMAAQGLSNSLLACAKLKDVAPAVLEAVPAMAVQVQGKAKDMKPQAFCNSLDALLLLEESVPEVADFLADDGSKLGIVRSAASHLNSLLPNLKGDDLKVAVPAVVWACAKVGVHHDELLVSVAERLRSQTKVSRLKDFGLSALYWSYQVLDAEDDFADFRKLLKSEITRRALSEADVESSKLGYLKWNRADV